MRIAFFMSDSGGSPLVIGLQRGLEQLGHSVGFYTRGQPYDLVVIFNQCAHTIHYHYPDFPEDAERIAFVDSAEYGYFKRLPSVIQLYANAFSPGSMAHDTKNYHEQTRLREFLQGRKFPYFLREHSKYVNYPDSYYPIDYPLYAPSECRQPPNREEYLARQLDLFVYWGASHPWRMQLTEALRECHTKCEITIIGENGAPRMPQHEYFARTRAAKVSVSFDGYGSGSFRVTEVLCRCLLLQGPMSIRRYAHLIDGVHCIEYGIEHNDTEFISTDICKQLRRMLDDPESSYRIYETGYQHCFQYYTEKATADYFLRTVQNHNYTIPTPLLI